MKPALVSTVMLPWKVTSFPLIVAVQVGGFFYIFFNRSKRIR